MTTTTTTAIEIEIPAWIPAHCALTIRMSSVSYWAVCCCFYWNWVLAGPTVIIITGDHPGRPADIQCDELEIMMQIFLPWRSRVPAELMETAS